jgi:tetratricopeptide (TPR) repeat protein
MRKLIFSLISLITLLTSCEKSIAKESNIDLQNYMQEFYKALNSNDKATIESGLLYLEQIKKERKVKISSLDYNMAQLLFKLKRYDEAREILRKSQEPTSKFYEITLLLRLGDTEVANKEIDNIFLIYRKQLMQATNLTEKKKIFVNMALLLQLSDRSLEILYADMIPFGLDRKDVESVIEHSKVNPPILLKTLWPD